MNIPVSIVDSKAKQEIQNYIYAYANKENIPIDRLCNLMECVLNDIEKKKADYYAQIVCQMMDAISKPMEDFVKEVKTDEQSVPENSVGELSE